MSKLKHLVLFFYFAIVSFSPYTFTQNNNCTHPDYGALVALNNSISGLGWDINDCDVCNWEGITCDENKRVVVLERPNNNLSGFLTKEIGNLNKLMFLNLSNNQLFGEIPKEIGNLLNIIILELNDNLITGNIPKEVSNIGLNNSSASVSIIFSDNNLSGCYPLELKRFCDVDLVFPKFISFLGNPNLPFDGIPSYCSDEGIEDKDNDGICNGEDCDDTNPTLPNSPGTTCDDGNPNTTNDKVGDDGCTCIGTPIGGGTANCEALQFTSENNQIVVSGLTPKSKIEIIGKNTNWQIVPICDDDCTETQTIPDLMAGEYTVKVQLFGQDGTYCYREEKVNVSDGGNGAITLVCRKDTSIIPPIGNGSIVFFDDPIASTSCPLGGLIIEQIEGLPSGSGFGIGYNTITFRARDACGNEATCSFRIIIGDTQPVIIGGQVFNDLNGNGFKEENELGIPNVTVIANGYTSSNQNGIFSVLASPGDFTITVKTPEGFRPTIQTGNVTNGIANDSDIDPVTGMTETFFVGSGERIETISAGFIELDNTTANCEALEFTAKEDRIHIMGLTPQSKVEYIGQNTGYQVLTRCDGNCATNGDIIPFLATGEYTVKVQLYGADGTYCYREEIVNVVSGCVDDDGDNICKLKDCNDNDPSIGVIGSACDDGNPNTINDILQTNCSCQGIPIGGGKADCSNLNFTGDNRQITIDGLDATYNKIEIIGRNTNWQVITICDGNCSDTHIIPDLMSGEYTVKVNQSGSDGSYCYREEKVSVQSSSSSRASNKIHFATYQKEQNVQLQWAVNTIEQTNYFLIERSFDGDTFEPLTLLANVAKDNTFQWTDEHPKTGKNHYRVRQVFYNNATLYSAVESEEFFLKEQEITLFPNPAQDLLNVHLHKLKGKTGSILIYSIFGQQVAQYDNVIFDGNLQTIEVAALENGLYWLTIKAANTRIISKRFVVERLR